MRFINFTLHILWFIVFGTTIFQYIFNGIEPGNTTVLVLVIIYMYIKHLPEEEY